MGGRVRVLVLATRLPVPPWRGDQVRLYHHLRVLARRHEIVLAALTLRRPEAPVRAAVAELGVRVEVVPLGLLGAAPALLRALLGDPRPGQVLLYLRRRAAARVRALIAGGRFDVVHAQLVRAAPYLPLGAGPPAVVDLIDALSLNFGRRAALARGPEAHLAAWEARRLARFERALLGRVSAALVVSEADRAALGERARVVPNGVDTEALVYQEEGRVPARLVFAGNLGYFPNVDAACWLAEEIFPRVRAALPHATLRIVGARPARAIRRLAARPGVSVAADVPAIAPELAAAAVAVIPMRAGSGMQNKVLEAMACGTPVVASPRAAAPLAVRAGEHLLVGEDAAGLAAATLTLLREPARARALARAARALVERCYRWEDSAAGVEAAWRASRGF
jgi:sugar transferase (PEP-CTERM/EpsH1 system associated)